MPWLSRWIRQRERWHGNWQHRIVHRPQMDTRQALVRYLKPVPLNPRMYCHRGAGPSTDHSALRRRPPHRRQQNHTAVESINSILNNRFMVNGRVGRAKFLLGRILLTIAAWREPTGTAERNREILTGRKAQLMGDLGHAGIRVAQQLLRPMHAQTRQIFNRRQDPFVREINAGIAWL